MQTRYLLSSKGNQLSRRTKITLSEAELVQAIRAKQKIGSEALYDMYSGSLYGLIVRIVQNNDLAEDLLQDTFVKSGILLTLTMKRKDVYLRGWLTWPKIFPLIS